MSKALLLDVMQCPEDFGLSKGDIIGRMLHYTPPIGGKVVFPHNMTGADEKQEFVVESDMRFYAFLFEGKVIGVSEETTSNILTLRGNRGYKKVKECIEKINGLYASDELGTKATGLTRKKWVAMPEVLRNMCRGYWLSSHYPTPYNNGTCCYKVGLVDSPTSIAWDWLYYWKSSNNCEYKSCSGTVRPTFNLDSKICVDIAQLHELWEPIKLILPEKPKKIVLPEIELPNQGGQ